LQGLAELIKYSQVESEEPEYLIERIMDAECRGNPKLA